MFDKISSTLPTTTTTTTIININYVSWIPIKLEVATYDIIQNKRIKYKNFFTFSIGIYKSLIGWKDTYI